MSWDCDACGYHWDPDRERITNLLLAAERKPTVQCWRGQWLAAWAAIGWHAAQETTLAQCRGALLAAWKAARAMQAEIDNLRVEMAWLRKVGKK